MSAAGIAKDCRKCEPKVRAMAMGKNAREEPKSAEK